MTSMSTPVPPFAIPDSTPTQEDIDTTEMALARWIYGSNKMFELVLRLGNRIALSEASSLVDTSFRDILVSGLHEQLGCPNLAASYHFIRPMVVIHRFYERVEEVKKLNDQETKGK